MVVQEIRKWTQLIVVLILLYVAQMEWHTYRDKMIEMKDVEMELAYRKLQIDYRYFEMANFEFDAKYPPKDPKQKGKKTDGR